jgi:hypothetical protein
LFQCPQEPATGRYSEQMNPMHTLTLCSFNINFILSSALRSRK